MATTTGALVEDRANPGIDAAEAYWNVGNFRIFGSYCGWLRELREELRNLAASLSWMGFEVASIPLPHHQRQLGKSSYTYWKLFRLAGNTIVAQMPLKITALIGLLIAVLSFIAG